MNKLITTIALATTILTGNITCAVEQKPSLSTKIIKLTLAKTKTKKPEKTPRELYFEALEKEYKSVTKDDKLLEALDTLKDTMGEFSRKAILGNNLTSKPIKVEFKNLATMGQQYSSFDALGWKKNTKLYIYVNQKHQDAPPKALAALLAHEALHQDEFNSINEETYAWTYEAAVWTELTKDRAQQPIHPLVVREETLKKLFIKGDYTSQYIKKAVANNPGYANLPSRSPGFEEEDL